MRLRAASTARLALQLALGLGALALFAWRVDLAAALRAMPHVDLRWAIPGVFVFTVSKLLHAYRWQLLLRHRRLPFRHIAAVFLTANFANAIIPLRVGDLLRVELPSRRFALPRAELTSSVFVAETLLDGFTFVILLSAGLVLLDLPAALRPMFGALAVVVLVLFVLMVTAANLRPRDGLSEQHWTIRWLPAGLRRRATRLVPEFLDGMRALRDARGAVGILAVSLAAWLAEVVVYAMMARAFGLHLNASEALVVMIGANLIVSLPITPWSVGPYEVVVTEALVVMGTSRAEASGFALGSHLLLLVWIAITGIFAMWTLDLRPRDLLPGRARPGLQPLSHDG